MSETPKLTPEQRAEAAILYERLCGDDDEIERFIYSAVAIRAQLERDLAAANAKLAAKPDVAGLVERLVEEDVIHGDSQFGTYLYGEAADALLSLSAQLQEKEAECAGLRQDAERYRWLRKHGNSFYNCVHYQGVDEVLDANVDAAIAARKP